MIQFEPSGTIELFRIFNCTRESMKKGWAIHGDTTACAGAKSQSRDLE